MTDLALRPLYGASSLRVKALDLHTRLFLWMTKKGIKGWKADVPTIDRVRPPREWGPTPLVDLPFSKEGARLQLPTIDEDWKSSDRARKIMLPLMRNGLLFPLKDREEHWICPEEARDTFQEVLPLGSYMTRPYHEWTEMSSDEAMSRLAFAGLGALRLLPYQPAADDPASIADAAWQHDLQFLSEYPVRPGFERYGARAIFDAEQRPIAIFWSHDRRWAFPHDDIWAHAKWAWRCTLMVGTTVTDHLVGVHWLIANYVTTASRVYLPPTHYLRLLLKPFTWRTIAINYSARDTLCPANGFVHRASAFTADGLTRAFGDSVERLQFHTVRQLIARKGAAGMGNRFPWATDALALFEVIRAFVADYIGRYATDEEVERDPAVNGFWDHLNTAPATVRFPPRSKEALVDVLAQSIWSVTGLHEAVGTVNEYVLDPTFMGTKIRAKHEVADVQASMQYLLIMALTGLQMPKLMEIGDAEGIFDADHRGREAFAHFHDELVALSAAIDAANVERRADPRRPWPCETFNPKHLETGVSI